MSKIPMKFAQWLTANHADQTTPLGDLARYAILDPAWPVRANSKHQFLDYLHSARAPESLIDSFQMAWKAYLLVESSQMGRK